MMRVVLHDWDDQAAIAILSTCRKAMHGGARLLIIEQVLAPPNEGDWPGKFGRI